MPTQIELKQLYDYADGFLIPKQPSTGIGFHGKDYHMMSIKNTHYYSHRLIYLWHHGVLPKLVEHIDRDKRNNKIENLREATWSQNLANRGKNKNNTSGFKGVMPNGKNWGARIQVNRKYIWLGTFGTAEEAAQAYDREAKQQFGVFAQLNFPLES
tara:strand:+ start:335 stop:802 length:468 start_codon:yes stop_codon:yes gene_type:complete